MKKLIMVLALTLLLVGCGHKEPVEEVVDTTNRAQSLADARTAELIVAEVEIAYTSAYMTSGNNPTVAEVSEKFSMDGVTMDKNGNITVTSGNVNCTTTSNTVLSVSCTGGDQTKTTTDLTISK